MCSLNSLRNFQIYVPHNHIRSLAGSFQNILCMHKLSDQLCNPDLHPPNLPNSKIYLPHNYIHGPAVLKFQNMPHIPKLSVPDIHLVYHK